MIHIESFRKHSKLIWEYTNQKKISIEIIDLTNQPSSIWWNDVRGISVQRSEQGIGSKIIVLRRTTSEANALEDSFL